MYMEVCANCLDQGIKSSFKLNFYMQCHSSISILEQCANQKTGQVFLFTVASRHDSFSYCITSQDPCCSFYKTLLSATFHVLVLKIHLAESTSVTY